MASIRNSLLRDVRDTYVRLGFAIPPEVDAALARGGTWIDAQHLLRLHDIDGPATARDASRRSTTMPTWPGAFAMLEKQALKLLGRRPQAMMRFYPGAYAMAMRGAGTAAYADDVSGGRIDFTGVPAELMEHAGFRAGTLGALQGLLERLGWRGELSETASTATGLTITMRWWRPVASPPEAPLEG